MKKHILFLALNLIGLVCLAQFSISGKVVDSDTKEPLQGASVFAQNTTRGTITDKDGSFTIYFDKGGYELVISFTGYDSKTITVQSQDHNMAIELQKADNSMSEVVIKSSNEVADGWDKYGKFFLEHFIGKTPFSDSCLLENPEALKFLYYKRNDRLKVLAREPLRIVNRALGYHLNYQLDSFVYFFKSDINSYRGLCLYSELEGNPEDKKQWHQNREKAYYGSRLHFLRSYYDSTLKEEGFVVDLLSEKEDTKFERLANPYDTSFYYFNDSTNDVELWFPRKVSVSYYKRFPDKEYLRQFNLPQNVRMQISYLTLQDGIIIKPNGYFFDQQSLINEGYWSWKNLADQLPYDYQPDN
jgi:CarboxypepD_reg-like domain